MLLRYLFYIKFAHRLTRLVFFLLSTISLMHIWKMHWVRFIIHSIIISIYLYLHYTYYLLYSYKVNLEKTKLIMINNNLGDDKKAQSFIRQGLTAEAQPKRELEKYHAFLVDYFSIIVSFSFLSLTLIHAYILQ